MLSIVLIQESMEGRRYFGVASNAPSEYVCRSPHTDRAISIPVTQGDSLPEKALRLILRDEPQGVVESLIEEIKHRQSGLSGLDSADAETLIEP